MRAASPPSIPIPSNDEFLVRIQSSALFGRSDASSSVPGLQTYYSQLSQTYPSPARNPRIEIETMNSNPGLLDSERSLIAASQFNQQEANQSQRSWQGEEHGMRRKAKRGSRVKMAKFQADPRDIRNG